MTYRKGIKDWHGLVKVEDGWAQPRGNTFIRIERCPQHPEEAGEGGLKEEKAKEIVEVSKAVLQAEFKVVADLARSHHLELPGKYLVMWGCRLPQAVSVDPQADREVAIGPAACGPDMTEFPRENLDKANVRHDQRAL